MLLKDTWENGMTQDKIVPGVIETYLETSPLMEKLDFKTVSGSAIAINREGTLPTVSFHSPNGVWTESTGTFTPITFALTILGGDCDVDNFLQTTEGNINDAMVQQIKMKSKVMARDWEKTAFYGDSSGTQEFDGLHALCDDSDYIDTEMLLHCGTTATGAALTLAKLDEAIDKVEMLGSPTCILMNKNIRRRMQAYLRANGSYTTARSEFGNYEMMWRDIPIMGSDWLVQTETISGSSYSAKTGGATSSIFVVYSNSTDGLFGIQNGTIQTEKFDKLENKDGKRIRLKWYTGLGVAGGHAISRIDGITDVAVTAA